MKVSDIKIFPCFETHPPKAEKLEQKEKEYIETGFSSADIVLDSQNYLIDGYCWYLIAKEKGLTEVPVRYGKRQIIRACHRNSSKAYCWEVPGILVDRINVGDKVKVWTKGGIQQAIVVAVEDYAGQDCLRTVYKRVRKAVA